MSIEMTMLGSEYQTCGTYATKSFGSVVSGISAGDSVSIQQKSHRMGSSMNEDALGVSELANGEKFYMVCDGRFGPQAAEKAAFLAPGIVEAELEKKPVQRALFDAAFRLDEKIREYTSNFPRNEQGATTFLGVLQTGDSWYFVSVGDSPLYVGEGDSLAYVNFPMHKVMHSKLRPCSTPVIGSQNENEYLTNAIANMLRPDNGPITQALRARGINRDNWSEEIRSGVTHVIGPERQDEFDGFYQAMQPMISVGELPVGSTVLLATDGIFHEESLPDDHTEWLLRGISEPNPKLLSKAYGCLIPPKARDVLKGAELERDVVNLFENCLKDGHDNTAVIAIRR